MNKRESQYLQTQCLYVKSDDELDYSSEDEFHKAKKLARSLSKSASLRETGIQTEPTEEGCDKVMC